MLNDKGVSEVIGAILLVSLVILGAMIVAVLFLSQPPPQEIPQVNAIAGNDTVGGVEYIYLLHDGGDPLTPIETVIRIDGGRDPGTIEISTEDGSYEPWTSGEWSVGKTLRITDDQPPESVTLVYSGGSSQALLLTSTFVETGSGGGGGPVPPVSLKADFTGMPRSGPAPLTVTFTDLSTGNPTQWVWNFGDGATSTEQNPDHTYTAPGTYTVTLTVTNAGGSDPETKLNFITVSSLSLKAEFEAYPTSGDAPLTVQFTDLSTGNPTQWNWDFGDGSTSTDQNPEHTYTTPGTYTVTLAATNAGGSDPETKPNYITVTQSFSNFIIDENVFIYGNILRFDGSTINGPQATVVINGGLYTSDINGGASIAATTIYFDGNVNLDGGSASLGSDSNPGNIYVNGDLRLWNGKRDIYGDVYVAGNFDLKDAWVHDTVYVDGDLTLGNTPTLDSNARIYYTGEIYYPQGFPQNILSKCIRQASVPGFDMPDEGLPPVRPDDWYAARGYVSGGPLASNLKIFADSYSSTTWKESAYNVIIIARNGDITLTGLGSSGVTGVLFAPNGRVTFNGGFFTGVILTRDGFFVTSGGTDVTFRNFEEFFSSPADYPF